MLKARPIDKRLCDLTGFQKSLIRSRLILYREGLGTTRATKSWAGIAIDISTLPDSNVAADLASEAHTNLRARWKYYAAVRPLRGVHKKHAELSSGPAQFSIGEDALNRWCSKGTEPVPEVISAVRDFLILRRYLFEFELETEDKALSVVLALGRLADMGSPPLFHSVYNSIGVTDQSVQLLTLHLEPWPATGHARVTVFSRKLLVQPNAAIDAEEWFAQPLATGPNDVEQRIGYVTLSAENALIAASCSIEEIPLPDPIKYWRIRSVDGETVSSFESLDLISFGRSSSGYIRPVSTRGKLVFISEKLDHKIALLNEMVYSYGIDFNAGFYKSEKWRLMGDTEFHISGEELYKLIKKWSYENKRAYAGLGAQTIRDVEVMRAIELVEDINYWSDEDQSSLLHTICRTSYGVFLNKIEERDDLQLLRRDGYGRLACELNGNLEDRTVEQARAAGITNIQDFFFGPGTLAAAMGSTEPPFEP